MQAEHPPEEIAVSLPAFEPRAQVHRMLKLDMTIPRLASQALHDAWHDQTTPRANRPHACPTAPMPDARCPMPDARCPMIIGAEMPSVCTLPRYGQTFWN